MKTCSTCRFLTKGPMGVKGCGHPLAIIEDRIHGDMVPTLDAPLYIDGIDPHGILAKCDDGKWHSSSEPKRRWWQL